MTVPRVESAEKYEGLSANSADVVLHTLDESIGTREKWSPVLARKGGHLDYSVRGRVG